MSVEGYKITKRNRYKCEYCDHTSYKTKGGILKHLEDNHALEQENALLRAKLKAVSAKPRVEVREKVIYRDPPKKPEPEYWYGAFFCNTCKIVMTRAGIPRGQTVEATPHSVCGTRALIAVREVQ